MQPSILVLRHKTMNVHEVIKSIIKQYCGARKTTLNVISVLAAISVASVSLILCMTVEPVKPVANYAKLGEDRFE